MTDEQRPDTSYFLLRIGSHAIDLIVCFALFYVIGMAVAARVGGLGARGEFSVQGLSALGILGAASIACFLYFVLTEAVFDRTLGKMACHLKVVREGEDSCGLQASLIRNLVRPIDSIFFYVVGLVAMLTSNKQQRLGDRAAGTRVIVESSSGLQGIGIVAVLGVLAVSIVGGLQIQTQARLNAKMTIQNMRFVEGEKGPATTKSYGAGEELFLTFDLVDIPQDAKGEMNTTVQLEPLDSSGRAMVAPVVVKVDGKPAEGSGRETPIHFHLTLPIYAQGGDHSIRISAKDAVLGRQVDQTATFNVMGPKVAAGAGFGVQDHAFVERVASRDTALANARDGSQDDGPPLADALYRPGGKVRTRFNVVGFQVGPQNRVKLRLDLGVVSETGEKLLDQPNVVNIDQDFFYTPAYLPITTSVDVPPDMLPGRYRIQYVVHDDVSGGQVSLEQPFAISP